MAQGEGGGGHYDERQRAKKPAKKKAAAPKAVAKSDDDIIESLILKPAKAKVPKPRDKPDDMAIATSELGPVRSRPPKPRDKPVRPLGDIIDDMRSGGNLGGRGRVMPDTSPQNTGFVRPANISPQNYGFSGGPSFGGPRPNDTPDLTAQDSNFMRPDLRPQNTGFVNPGPTIRRQNIGFAGIPDYPTAERSTKGNRGGGYTPRLDIEAADSPTPKAIPKARGGGSPTSNSLAKGNRGGGYTPKRDRDTENRSGPAGLFTRLSSILPRIRRRSPIRLLDS